MVHKIGALGVLLLLAGLVAASECFTVGEDVEMGEFDERLVDAIVCGTGNYHNISPETIAFLLIVVVISLIFYGFVRTVL